MVDKSAEEEYFQAEKKYLDKLREYVGAGFVGPGEPPPNRSPTPEEQEELDELEKKMKEKRQAWEGDIGQ